MLKTPLLAALLVISSPALAGDAATLFKANGCTACHDPNKDQVDRGLGPSLSQIADAYRGQPGKLVEFLRGDSKPILYPEKYPLMKAQLPRVMALSDAELDSLADYLLGF